MAAGSLLALIMIRLFWHHHSISYFIKSLSLSLSYQINARTELAIRYNDKSPLENHHCAVAFQILEKVLINVIRTIQDLAENSCKGEEWSKAEPLPSHYTILYPLSY